MLAVFLLQASWYAVKWREGAAVALNLLQGWVETIKTQSSEVPHLQ